MALDREQLQAVNAPAGHIMVIAPPGSGKTAVLTERIHMLIRRGVAPSSILAVTFTKKAAGEIESRLKPRLGNSLRGLWDGTFHSICYRILRAESSALRPLGYEKGFAIVDDTGAEAIMKDVLDELGQGLLPGEALNAISLHRLTLGRAGILCDVLEKAASLYRRHLVRMNAMDFDDLLVNTLKLLHMNREIRLKYARRFEHVVVDEFQDIDPCQWELIKLFASVHGNLFAVGDPQQSIFGFRGGSVGITLEYMRDPHTRTYMLRRNYRSKANIVAAADSLMRHSGTITPIPQVPARGWGAPIDLYIASNDFDEAMYVAELIEGLLLRGTDPGKIAVLTRTKAQSAPICRALMRARIPYRLSDSQGPCNGVRVMTMHASKGKEFGHVILPGLEEGIIPHFRATSETEVEEERRLMYVALTRAKDRLYLSYSMERAVGGISRHREPSRFLREIDGSLLVVVNFREVGASYSRTELNPLV